MKEPPDLGELLGGDLPPAELERLRRVDATLRRVPPPPHDVPQSLTQAVARLPERPRPLSRRRIAVALAFAAALAALAFGLGRWTAREGFEPHLSIALQPTANASGATASLQLGQPDEESGNIDLRLDVAGLPQLPRDRYYALWLSKDGEWAATCGYFSVGAGETTVRMTVSYDFEKYDSWVISKGPFENPTKLLKGRTPDT
jgi:hypothetical protein